MLSAFLMILMMFVCAVALDVGYLYVSRVEAQRSADAAAMAATWDLASEEYATGVDTTQAELAARDTAALYVFENPVAGVRCVADKNLANSAGGDIVLGRMDDPGNPGGFVTSAIGDPYNAVRVRVRRDEDHNGSIGMFFAAILGTATADMSAAATAMFQDNITGFQISDDDQQCSLMPFVVHESTWQAWLDGEGDDDWSYDPETKLVTAGGDGVREFRLFADGNGGGNKGGNGAVAPGNFGAVDIGNPNNSAVDLKRQIRNGPNAADFAYHGGELTLGPSGTLTLNGDTGITASIKDALGDIVGDSRTVMVYREVAGNGNNTYFTIVGFVGVRLVDYSMTGNNKYLCVQPGMSIDPSAVGTYTDSASWFVGQPVQLVQ